MSFRAQDLLNLVREHGETLTLRKKSYGAYDPVEGQVSSTSSQDYSITGYFYTYNITSVDDIRRGTRKCVIPALGLSVVPDDEDEILGSGDTVHITRILTMYSAGTALCYICDVSE
jgi:hypothetical protein